MTKFYDTWFTSGNMNSVCEHGNQRRKCVACESAWQYEIIDKLESENKRLREALEAISLMVSPAPHVKDIVRQALEEK